MPSTQLQIDRWAAWAPGLESQEAWLQWLRDPVELTASGTPPLSEMPAMMRRRIEPLGRVALQAAYWAQGGGPTGPVVFASRWGELARSVEMLTQLAAGEPLSPTAFSLSVHNAIGALFSIARKDKHNYQAVSAGEFSLEAGFAEACGLIADGAGSVLLVFVDCPLPELYAEFASPQTARFPYAFACMLSLAQSGAGTSLATQPGDGALENMPSNFDVMRLLLDVDVDAGAEVRRQRPASTWLWKRLAP